MIRINEIGATLTFLLSLRNQTHHNSCFQVNKSMAKEFIKHRAVQVESLCFVNVYLVNGTFERTG